MAGLTFRKRKSEETDQLENLLELAQGGDRKARNELLQSYVPFILRAASQASGRYIDRNRDDEYSIALLAMNEAIDCFDAQRQARFLGFAETIIRRRLIDYFRSQKSSSRAVPWTEFDVTDDEDNIINYVEVKSSVDAHQRAQEHQLRTQEIQEYAALLSEFGLVFSDLVEASPKHADARQNAIDVARIVVMDDTMKNYVMEKRTLPLKLLESKVGVSRKTMERQRKYILAIVLLLCGDFQCLKAYIS